MQRRGCEAIQLLLSKYADNEATDAEHEQVMSHVATCADCGRRLADYEQVAALFRAEPTLPADPSLRVGLFKEINHLKEEERRQQREVSHGRHWYLPAAPARRAGKKSPAARLWGAASPLVAASLAVFGLLGLTLFLNKTQTAPEPSNKTPDQVSILPVPTVLATALVSMVGSDPTGSYPPPVSTKAADATLLPAYTSGSDIGANTDNSGVLSLSRATPFLESESATAEWHSVRDATYGYSISYPTNWWTQTDGNTRYFRPWVPGGDEYLPYWIELQVRGNDQHLTAATAKQAMFNGQGEIQGRGSTVRLRHQSSDPTSVYDEIYSFDPQYIYVLRLAVPQQSASGAWQARWNEADAVFSRMSDGKTYQLQPSTRVAQAPTGYGPVLFLNGADLWAVDYTSGRTFAITQGGFKVRQFTLSLDMKSVAFTSAKTENDTWAKTLYISTQDSNGFQTPVLVWSEALDIHDIAWYSEHRLVAIARTQHEGLGLYTIDLPARGIGSDDVAVERLAALDGSNMTGAKGLAVSPDRQLLTFMAPLGESQGTDIYALRPDGTDLKLLVSHTLPLSPSTPAGRVLAPEGQAIKSYVWTDGRLDYRGYKYSLLFTCGNATSPTFYKGGFLYSAPGAAQGTLLDNQALNQPDPTKLQITHIAYSSLGKVAMTGYYNDRVAGRADQLAGLWTARLSNGTLTEIAAMPIPAAPHGITDLQWAPDGRSLIYRETMPGDTGIQSASYYARDPFAMVKLDTENQTVTVLYTSGPR